MKPRHRKLMTLQDLVKIVSQCSRTDEETTAVVTDLLNRGVVRLGLRTQSRRAIVR